MKKEKEWKVYCYTNVLTNEKYVGVTNKSIKQRAGKNGAAYINKGQRFGEAIEEYGWGNFDAEILAVTTSELEASKFERFYIEKFQSDKDGLGYNKNKGGGTSTKKEIIQFSIDGKIMREYSSLKEANEATGVLSHNIIECCRGRTKIAGGYIWRYKGEFNYGLSDKDITPFSGERAVIQMSLDGDIINEFPSAKEAQEKTGALRSKICMCCKNQRHTAGGYKWKYVEESDMVEKYHPRPSLVRKVGQYDMEGNLLDVFESQSDAHRKTGYQLLLLQIVVMVKESLLLDMSGNT